jgi:hypothetical protein
MSTELVLSSSPNTVFEYGFARVRDMLVSTTAVAPKRGRAMKSVVNGISLNGGEVMQASKRFWTSMQTRFGFSPNIIRYFSYEELFHRISTRSADDSVRYCVERDTQKNTARLLAVTNPAAAAVKFDQLQGILGQYGVEKVAYADGIVRSTHSPRAATGAFQIAGDDFVNQFVIDTPIDGYGKPDLYLSMMRLICSNGAIGYGKAFRSELNVGKKDEDVVFALIRAIDGFNNEEGYAALRKRFDAATNSWASVNEAQKLQEVLIRCGHRGQLLKRGIDHTADGQAFETAQPIFQALTSMTGNIAEIYGLSNIETLSAKRQRTLPVRCKVYDLLNFATEVATHHTVEGGARVLQAYVGELISHEYDLEGTVDQFSDWRDFFVGSTDTAETMEIIRSKQ